MDFWEDQQQMKREDFIVGNSIFRENIKSKFGDR